MTNYEKQKRYRERQAKIKWWYQEATGFTDRDVMGFINEDIYPSEAFGLRNRMTDIEELLLNLHRKVERMTKYHEKKQVQSK